MLYFRAPTSTFILSISTAPYQLLPPAGSPYSPPHTLHPYTMSRSALWRQEANVQDRQRRAEETFAAAIEEGRRRSHLKNVIPLAGPDDAFNIHPMLLQNIAKSPYFQKCCDKLTDWNMVVDEIYYEVKHMEPWTAGECTVDCRWL